MTSPKNRLNEAMSWIDITQSELSKISGVTAASISGYRNGNHSPTRKNAELLAKALNVSSAWLMGLSDDPSRERASRQSIDAGVASNVGPVRIPVLSKIAAGVPMEAMESHIDDDDPDTWEEIPGEWMHGDKAFFALKVSGDSMSPDIPDGSIAIIERCYEWRDGKVMAVYVNGYNATLKRVKLKDGGIVLLEAFNPSFETQVYTAEEVEKTPVKPCGILVETRKKW